MRFPLSASLSVLLALTGLCCPIIRSCWNALGVFCCGLLVVGKDEELVMRVGLWNWLNSEFWLRMKWKKSWVVGVSCELSIFIGVRWMFRRDFQFRNGFAFQGLIFCFSAAPSPLLLRVVNASRIRCFYCRNEIGFLFPFWFSNHAWRIKQTD